ncbi:uncharacterized protein CBL_11243 [Carabus blaptoides fortunei]
MQLLAFALLAAVTSAHVARYDNYKVYRMFPNTESQLKALRQLEDTTVDFDFWRGPSAKNASVEIMVAPHKEPHFHELMDELKLVATPYITNVQSLIDETNRKNMKTNRFGWNAYYDSAEENVSAYLAFHSFSQLLLIPYGHSYEHLDNYEELVSLPLVNNRSNMQLLVCVALLAAVASAHVARYDNYKVYRMFPNTDSQLKALRQLEDTTVDFDFWKGPSAKYASVEIMVAPHKEPHFHELMDELKLVATPYIPNVQSLIDQTNRKNMKTNRFGWNAYYDSAELIDTLAKELSNNYDLITLSAKKWPWRARCSALLLSQLIPRDKNYSVLFCSSVLSLTELVGLRPDLQTVKKIVYFHENQLIYPKQQIKERDFQFGYNQITSCLVADIVVFNSCYNKTTFLETIAKFIKLMPDCRPGNLCSQIEPKCVVLYFPIHFEQISVTAKDYTATLHIVWPHRWEFDKGPEELFQIMFRLKETGVPFKLSVLGETFQDVPAVFHEARTILEEHIEHWGFVESKEDYYNILNEAHVVLSTAKHEFYGVAVLEAVHCGCYPVVPDRLVYPEIYEKCCLYKDTADAVDILRNFAENPAKLQATNTVVHNLSKYSSQSLLPEYLKLLCNK